MPIFKVKSAEIFRNYKEKRLKSSVTKPEGQFCLLELRQYKNGFVSVIRMFVLKMPVFYPCRAGGCESHFLEVWTTPPTPHRAPSPLCPPMNVY